MSVAQQSSHTQLQANTHTHTHTASLTHTHTHTHIHTHTHTGLSHTHTNTGTHIHINSRSHVHPNTEPLAQTHTGSRIHIHIGSQTHTNTASHTHTHTHTGPHTQNQRASRNSRDVINHPENELKKGDKRYPRSKTAPKKTVQPLVLIEVITKGQRGKVLLESIPDDPDAINHMYLGSLRFDGSPSKVVPHKIQMFHLSGWFCIVSLIITCTYMTWFSTPSRSMIGST